MRYIYPAIFEQDGENYNVRFPDLQGCHTFGNGLQEAYDMAGDALCLMLYTLEEAEAPIPSASNVADIKTMGDEFVSLVSCDTLEYRQFYDNKAVKKTLTIPSWLNTMAERAGVNFSAVLQEALRNELQITGR